MKFQRLIQKVGHKLTAKALLIPLLTMINMCLGPTAIAQGTNQSDAANPSEAVGRHCYVTKSSKLAMDQRDDARIACLKKKVTEMSTDLCLTITKSMEYSISAEEGRLICLHGTQKNMNLKECIKISKSMEFPDSGDDVRWECLRGFNKTITPKQCQQLAQSMSYPTNRQRAQYYCLEELP